jgi:hypothetical protein
MSSSESLFAIPEGWWKVISTDSLISSPLWSFRSSIPTHSSIQISENVVFRDISSNTTRFALLEQILTHLNLAIFWQRCRFLDFSVLVHFATTFSAWPELETCLLHGEKSTLNLSAVISFELRKTKQDNISYLQQWLWVFRLTSCVQKWTR